MLAGVGCLGAAYYREDDGFPRINLPCTSVHIVQEELIGPVLHNVSGRPHQEWCPPRYLPNVVWYQPEPCARTASMRTEYSGLVGVQDSPLRVHCRDAWFLLFAST